MSAEEEKPPGNAWGGGGGGARSWGQAQVNDVTAGGVGVCALALVQSSRLGGKGGVTVLSGEGNG